MLIKTLLLFSLFIFCLSNWLFLVQKPVWSLFTGNFIIVLFSCLLFYLKVNFIAICFLMVYSGAIMVLFLFCIFTFNSRSFQHHSFNTINFTLAYFIFSTLVCVSVCLFFSPFFIEENFLALASPLCLFEDNFLLEAEQFLIYCGYVFMCNFLPHVYFCFIVLLVVIIYLVIFSKYPFQN
jgi:NADH:ubiquinone oxidoreductase subunit 6 (subunit J)